jgi:hypothetical protein
VTAGRTWPVGDVLVPHDFRLSYGSDGSVDDLTTGQQGRARRIPGGGQDWQESLLVVVAGLGQAEKRTHSSFGPPAPADRLNAAFQDDEPRALFGPRLSCHRPVV